MQETDRPKHPDRIVPDDIPMPTWNSLTEEQQREIDSGPGWVRKPAVGLPDFADLGSFIPKPNAFASNNFFALFIPEGEWLETSSGMPAFQRFQILYPGMLEQLRAAMEACGRRPRAEVLWKDLFQAHKILRALVDVNDPGVLLGDGRVMNNYLLR